jgi:hypothetical protein
MRKFVLLLLIVLASCSSPTLEDYREEGESITRSLIKQFQSIYSREDLVHAEYKIKLLFNRLVNVMMDAHALREKLSVHTIAPLSADERLLSDKLRAELNRLYRLEGGREMIERWQEEPLYRLDAYLSTMRSKTSSKRALRERN